MQASDAAVPRLHTSVTAFEVMSRCYPYAGMGQPEVMRLASACFEVQAAMLRFASEEQQRMGWNEVCNGPSLPWTCHIHTVCILQGGGRRTTHLPSAALTWRQWRPTARRRC